MATTVLSGLGFGAALVAAGVYQPGIIIKQLKLEDWHMIQAFLAATASSALVVFTLDRLDFYHPTPRSASRLALLGPYDGNIVGGALQGLGMALSGACPGTVVSQAATGSPSGLYALAGAALGGIIWSGFLSDAISRRLASAKRTAPVDGKPTAPPVLTIYERLGVSHTAALVVFEAACAAAVLAAPASSRYVALAPALGGIAIGLSQLFSVLSRKTMLGVSTSYDELGKYFWWLARGDAVRGTAAPSNRNLLFVAGVAAGSWGLATLEPKFAPIPNEVSVEPVAAVVGGLLLAVGSRVAGGCTSGHGVSGMSMFSISSFITIGTMFGVGALAMPLFA
ncbi:YeeE/YedE family protein [Plectosphaerella plurivora]|uniref:YeeE/YedE family protein n=1 Tax=Plectosphaerella plurivora TaxID=936078 RepID=A0A9P8VHB5_9PEZI|nr:YeeE/YedE family protein [Plectosphaerella plurivora]